MTVIARIPVGGQVIVTDENDQAICNLEVTRGPDGRLILHAMQGESTATYADLTITAKSILLGVVPGGNPANGHVYYLAMDGGDLVLAPDKPIRFRPTGEGFVDIWPQDTPGGLNNMEVGSQVPKEGRFTDCRVAKFAMGTNDLKGPLDVGCAATDLASAIALVNAIRQAFRERGDFA